MFGKWFRRGKHKKTRAVTLATARFYRTPVNDESMADAEERWEAEAHRPRTVPRPAWKGDAQTARANGSSVIGAAYQNMMYGTTYSNPQSGCSPDSGSSGHSSSSSDSGSSDGCDSF